MNRAHTVTTAQILEKVRGHVAPLPTVTGMNVCHHAIGWANPTDVIKGFPGMVSWDGEHHTMNMFVPQAHYDFETQDQAIADVVNVSTVDLSAIMADVLAEG